MKLLSRNPLAMQNSNLIKNGTLRGLFSFFGLFCYKSLTVKEEKMCKKRYLEVVPIKCQGKKLFLVNIYFV